MVQEMKRFWTVFRSAAWADTSINVRSLGATFSLTAVLCSWKVCRLIAYRMVKSSLYGILNKMTAFYISAENVLLSFNWITFFAVDFIVDDCRFTQGALQFNASKLCETDINRTTVSTVRSISCIRTSSGANGFANAYLDPNLGVANATICNENTVCASCIARLLH